jgi:hypothetical protein
MTTRGCPVAPACESCPAVTGLAVWEADTPLGVICLTLCARCADGGQVPRLSCPAAALRALAHGQHTSHAAPWQSAGVA